MNKDSLENETGTKTGIRILTHLKKIYEELISDTFGKYQTVKNPQGQILPCMCCKSLDTYMIWSENYSGYRGVCEICECNWPES